MRDASSMAETGTQTHRTVASADDQSQAWIKELERLRSSRVLTLFFSFDATIDRDTVDAVYDKLRKEYAGLKQLDVLVESAGGDIDAAFGVTKILRRFAPERLTFIVPRWAKSAATLLVCGGDEIVMGPTSELGPLDPQITGQLGEEFSPLSIQSTLDLLWKEIEKGHRDLAEVLAREILPLNLGEFVRSLDIAKTYLRELLTTRMFAGDGSGEQKAEQTAEKLAKGYVHHGYVIDFDEAKKLQLKVIEPQDDQWDLVWRLYSAFWKKEKERHDRLHKDLGDALRKGIDLERLKNIRRDAHGGLG